MLPLSDLPAEWLATLKAIVDAPTVDAAVARFWGCTPALIADGWVCRWETPEGKTVWQLTAAAAEELDVVLVERIEGEPRWRPVRRTPGLWQYPDPPLRQKVRPDTRSQSDSAWLNVPDPHSAPSSAEARRRQGRRAKRRERRERRRAG